MKEALLQELYHLQNTKRINPSLKNITKALAGLGNPQNTYPTIHITGTNGKGTTAALLMQALQPFHKIGLYTSPHLLCFEERIQINGQVIPKKKAEALYQKIKPLIQTYHLTFFEATTVMAFLYFAEEKIDLGIIEVGMGGRWDATNVITPLISVITAIDEDHQDYLGDLSQIIEEKSGIIKPKIQVITLAENKGRNYFEEKAKALKSPFFAVAPTTPKYQSLLPFSEQASLAEKALSLLQAYGFKHDKQQWEHFHWPGRFQWITKNILADGAHNPHGIKWLVQQLQRINHKEQWKKTIILFSCVKEKDAKTMLQPLAKEADEIVVTDFPFFRSQKKEKIQESFSAAKSIAFKEIRSWLTAQPQEHLVVITGSLYFLGTLFQALIKKQDVSPELSRALRSAFPHHECLEDVRSFAQ